MRKFCPSIASLVAALLLLQNSGAPLYAQAAVPSAQELDQLLAPIALYPDALVAQITSASTIPQEILDVDAWLKQNGNLNGAALADAAQQQGFDPQFIALVSFPQVLDMMAQNIDDYAAIGAAFSANQGAVTDSIQRLRAQAYSYGTLQSNTQQQVIQQPQDGRQVIIIQPANPQVVYVPVYDPGVVYAGPSSGAIIAGMITFGAGIAIGAALANDRPWGWGGWGWNWGGRTVIVNHNTWIVNNRYRSRRPVYRPRPPRYSSRPGYNGHWGRPGSSRPGSGGRPGYTRPPSNNRPPSGNRPPGYTRPTGTRPGGTYQPGNRPPTSGTRPPGSTRPSPGATTKPAPAPRPTTRPAPAPTAKPATRPAPAPRPTTANRSPYAGFPPKSGNPPTRQAQTGGRPSAFGSGSSGPSARAASSRGQRSMGGGGGGKKR